MVIRMRPACRGRRTIAIYDRNLVVAKRWPCPVTLRELEYWLAVQIIGPKHAEPHRGIMLLPLREDTFVAR